MSWITTDAAKIAELDSRIGSITPGKQADVTMLRKSDINISPTQNVIGCVVMQATPANVDTVVVAGRLMKRDGRLLYGNLPAKLAELTKSGERILSDFKNLPSEARFFKLILPGR